MIMQLIFSCNKFEDDQWEIIHCISRILFYPLKFWNLAWEKLYSTVLAWICQSKTIPMEKNHLGEMDWPFVLSVIWWWLALWKPEHREKTNKRPVWRNQRGNKIPKIEEQIIQWSKGQTLIYETLHRKLKIYM